MLGVDIAGNLVEAGNARVRSLGLTNCRFEEGDATDLRGLEDDRFDLVVSIFGAMFAPKPDDVAKEVVRVTRPGGRIVMGNWIPNDPTLVAQILKISSAYSPPPPEGFISPMTWGVEQHVTERFVSAASRNNRSRSSRHVHLSLSSPTLGAPRRIPDVLWADDERIRSRRWQRPGSRAAGRAGSPIQRPECQQERRPDFDPRNVPACDCFGLTGTTHEQSLADIPSSD